MHAIQSKEDGHACFHQEDQDVHEVHWQIQTDGLYEERSENQD